MGRGSSCRARQPAGTAAVCPSCATWSKSECLWDLISTSSNDNEPHKALERATQRMSAPPSQAPGLHRHCHHHSVDVASVRLLPRTAVSSIMGHRGSLPLPCPSYLSSAEPSSQMTLIALSTRGNTWAKAGPASNSECQSLPPQHCL